MPPQHSHIRTSSPPPLPEPPLNHRPPAGIINQYTEYVPCQSGPTLSVPCPPPHSIDS
ncbi:hypothetical protein M6B38_408405 [Iris pallida]|uniref:Uncharacterized protein n=1 Tax=Iris pallida TaxID=29817 RepID=A0AAX6F6I7_IRIPA|nr:hypothetical protein M6B38_153350 [Iris pallida]KAJ6818368.1 hypothetical protein M6B38_408405 [Iris pallida]